MKGMLYEACPVCEGKGAIADLADEDESRLCPCPAGCKVLSVAESGVTAAQVGKLMGDFDRCRDDWQAAIEECDEALDRVHELEAEVVRLQALTQGLADRVAAQSDLLSRRAEKGGGP